MRCKSLKVTILLAAAWGWPGIVGVWADGQMAVGVVFEDRNSNGRKDAGAPGIGGVAVSNQREVVLTDQEGNWSLPPSGETVFFVTQPAGYRAPVNEHNLPRFFYIHQPAGSPGNGSWRFGGVEPTGPLPGSIDFPLLRDEHPEGFQALALAEIGSRITRRRTR